MEGPRPGVEYDPGSLFPHARDILRKATVTEDWELGDA